MDIKTLKNKLSLAWCAETASGEWNKNNPSLNQCAVTALIVQDYFGGDLLRCKMTDGNSHYWNRLPNGTEQDLTVDQFSLIKVKPNKSEFVIRERNYVLSFPDTVIRYVLLKNRLNLLLGN